MIFNRGHDFSNTYTDLHIVGTYDDGSGVSESDPGVRQEGERWLNLQGQPVALPEGGLFIRVSEEGKAEKVLRR